MAQETHQNESCGTINLRNNQLQHLGALAVLNHYCTSGDLNSVHHVSYSPAKLSFVTSVCSSSVTTPVQYLGSEGRTICLPVCTVSQSNYSHVQGSSNVISATSFTGGSVTYVHCNTTSQPDMLEMLLSRNAYSPQLHTQTHASKVVGSVISATQVLNQNSPVMSGLNRNTVIPAAQPVSAYSNAATVIVTTTNNANAPSVVATDPEKRQLIQQQLILLLHARRCQRQEDESNERVNPCTTAHCNTMRAVLKHMSSCTQGKNCQTPHCASSRQIISHWKNCHNRECPVCEPLKQNQNYQRNQVVRQPQSSSCVYARPPSEVNGVDPSVQTNLPQQSLSFRMSSTVVSTGNTSVFTGPSVLSNQQDSESININGVSSHVPTTSISEISSWRKSVDMAQRDHVVRRIVRFIFPFPDPAAYSDPRMRNLIEYARKVEREMYSTARSIDHYFHLLAQKCYKIHRELEEKRKSRQVQSDNATCNTQSVVTNSAITTSNLLTVPNQLSSPNSVCSVVTTSIKPTAGVSNGSCSLNENYDQGSFNTQDVNNSEVGVSKFEHYLQSTCNRGRYKIDPNPDGSESTSSAFVNSSTSSISLSDDSKFFLSRSTESIEKRKSELKCEEGSSEVVVSDDSFPVTTSLATNNSTLAVDMVPVKPDVSKWKKWSKEELLRYFLQLHEEIYNDKYAEPFRAPVDPVMLHIPDYFQVIKEPMDLTTIRNNLEDGKYKDPWHVIDDYRLMFNNAWLYNKKTSKVYKMCSKLAELFQSRIDQVMQAMGFCCGQDCEYQPQGLYCSSPNLCTISRDATYYVYLNNDKQGTGLVCDKYYQCEKCFGEAGDFVILADEPDQPVQIKREVFEKRKNNVKEKEEFVICLECGRQWHKVCALHMNEIWTSGFVCLHCLKEKSIKRKENKYSAKKLPVTKLSTFLEKRVNDFLKKKEVNTGEVTIRVLASSDKTVEVKPLMRARFTESGELSESFPYRLKAIFAFQEIDGQDVCFFGLYVQEYGSESPQPNRRRVYVAYLDSVFFFRPKQYRTDVYHEILVAYLLYAKRCGYTMAHIWACPPGEGDDYIFHMHPSEQKIPKAKRLQEWYRRMLEKAIIEGIVVDYKNILKDALDHQLVSPTEIPYFEGDFWPNTLEDILKELEEEEARRRREEAMAQAEAEDDDTDCSSLMCDGLSGDQDKRSGKKKAKKRKINKKNNSSTASKRKRSDGPIDGAEELSRKVYDTMEKLKEIFFVIRLHRHSSAASLPPIIDPDPPINSELMDSRDAFLQMARERHLEFSSLRRAKFSTMVLLYELHMELRQSFMYNCNVCSAQIETRWHCNECEEYDLCSRCYKVENHPHPMVQYGLGIDEDTVNNEDSGDHPNGVSSTPDRRTSIEGCIRSLLHACQCRDANCRMQTCAQMKRVLFHARNCNKKATNTCLLCRQLLSLLWHHARSCDESKCPVPYCLNIKYRVKQKQLQRRLQQNKLLRRRISTMHRGTVPTGDSQNLSQNCNLSSTVNASTPLGNLNQAQSLYNQSVNTPVRANQLSGTSHLIEKPHAISPHSSYETGSVIQSQVQQGSMYTFNNQQSRIQSQGVITQQLQVSPRIVTLPSTNRVVIQSTMNTGLSQSQTPNTTSVNAGWRVRPTLTSGQHNTNNLHQLQSVSAPTHSSNVTSNQVTGQKPSMSKPKPQDIEYVSQVISLIKASKTSSDDQNRRFIDWIKRHPEYHTAFFALHSQHKKQAELRAQSGQRRVTTIANYVNATSIPLALSSSLSVLATGSSIVDASHSSLGSNSNSVVIVPSSVGAGSSTQGTILSRCQPQNIGHLSAPVSNLPVVTNPTSYGSTPTAVVHQPLQWISIQSPVTTNHHQPLITGCTTHSLPNTTTLRFRAVSGTATFVQSQHQQVQHFYNTCSLSGDQTFGNNDSDLGMFVSAPCSNVISVGGQSSQVSALPQRLTTVSNNVVSLGRQSTTPQAAIVHFRSQHQPLGGGAVNSMQPHIILTNSSAPGSVSAHLGHQSQTQIVSAPGSRQVVALMTHQGVPHAPNGSDQNISLRDSNSVNSGSGLGNGVQ